MQFHHLGFFVKDVEKHIQNMPHGNLINAVYDPIQQAHLSLYDNFGGGYIELVQPDAGSSQLWNQIEKRGEHLNHLAYEIEGDCLDDLKQQFNLIQISKPVPAVLFENREIVFCLSRSNMIIEFIMS